MIILIPYLQIFTPGSSGLTELQLLLKKIAGRERMGGALDYYRQKQAGEKRSGQVARKLDSDGGPGEVTDVKLEVIRYKGINRHLARFGPKYGTAGILPFALTSKRGATKPGTQKSFDCYENSAKLFQRGSTLKR